MWTTGQDNISLSFRLFTELARLPAALQTNLRQGNEQRRVFVTTSLQLKTNWRMAHGPANKAMLR